MDEHDRYVQAQMVQQDEWDRQWETHGWGDPETDARLDRFRRGQIGDDLLILVDEED